ncbi:MAG: hypothetical protein GXP44_01150 [bacterium]|nr:hypothetical protein [bacterium]
MPLTKEKIEYFKEKLNKRKAELEKELSVVARKNPDVKGDWEPTQADMNPMVSDRNEMADTFEEMEERAVVEDSLEEQFDLVVQALERVKKGTYGICETCGEDIDERRLEALPAAKNCVKHTKNK